MKHETETIMWMCCRQMAKGTLKNTSGGSIKKSYVVVPASDEINCAQCRMQGMDGIENLSARGDPIGIN